VVPFEIPPKNKTPDYKHFIIEYVVFSPVICMRTYPQNRFLIQFVFLLATIIIISASIMPRGALADGTTKTKIEWGYGLGQWVLESDIPNDDYTKYKEVPVSERTKGGVSGYGLLITTSDPSLKSIAKDLKDWITGEEYSAFDAVSGVLAMIQQMEYTPDNVTTAYDEYPKFPLEVIRDDGGDCEDTSILFVTLMELMDYDAVLLYFDQTATHSAHMAAAVSGYLSAGVQYYEHDGKKYYYCETTGALQRYI